MDNNNIKNIPSSKNTQNRFLLVLLLSVSVLIFFIFAPFATPLVLAAVFAVFLHPLFLKISKVIGGRRAISSILSILIACIVVLAPLSFLGSQIFKQSRDLYVKTTTDRGEYLENIDRSVENIVGRVIPDFSFEVEKYIGAISEFTTNNLAEIFSGTVQTVFFFFITIFALFFFLKDGDRFKEMAIALSPLPDINDLQIITRLKKAVNSVVRGFLLISLIQGIVAGIGFTIFGIPHPALWGAIAAIAALIPGVGTALVTVPAIIFLFASGSPGLAIGLAIWGALAVGLVDNMLGPSLVGKGIRIHPLFVLFSVLGGLVFFGPAGFILGPLALALLYALLDVYRTGLQE